MRSLFTRKWGQWRTGIVEREIKRRIKLAIWAYAYEYEHKSLVDDSYFDKQCLMVNPEIDTGKPDLDKFFRTVFHPCTGSWIGEHPELKRLSLYYRLFYADRPNYSDHTLPDDPICPYWAQREERDYDLKLQTN